MCAALVRALAPWRLGIPLSILATSNSIVLNPPRAEISVDSVQGYMVIQNLSSP
jgi:hypothetical protein